MSDSTLCYARRVGRRQYVALQLEPSKLLVSYSALAQTRGGLLTHSVRNAVNAAQVSNAQEALEPVGTFARQVLRHLLQQQAHSCCLQQC